MKVQSSYWEWNQNSPPSESSMRTGAGGIFLNKRERVFKKLARVMVLTCAAGFFTGTVSAETVKLSLADSVQMALENNRSIKQALTDVDAAHWSLSEARRSMGPRLTWESTAARIGGEAYESARAFGSEKYHYNYGNTGTIAMPVYNAALSAQRRAARYALSAADLALEQTKQSVRLAATKGYFNILQARNLVKIREDAVATLTVHLNDVNAQLRAGTVARADVLASEVELANAAQNLTTAKNSYEIAVAALNNVIGLTTDAQLQIEDELRYVTYEPSLADCTDYALLNRADGAAAVYAVRRAEAGVRAARAGYLPTVNAAVSREIAGEHAFGSEHTSSNQWSAGLRASWNAFDNGVTDAQVQAAKAALRKAEEAEAATEEQIRLDVRTAYLNLRAAEQNIKTTKTAVQQAEEDYKIARIRYNAGVGTNLEVMRASDNLTTARMNYDTSLYTYNTSKASLDQAMGTPVDLNVMRYRAAEEEGKRAKEARAAARLDEKAIFETPAHKEVRVISSAPTPEEGAGAVRRIEEAAISYRVGMEERR